jgi:hypothetical protein
MMEEEIRRLEPDETVIAKGEDIDMIVRQAANLAKQGYEIVGAGRCGDQLSVIVNAEDDEIGEIIEKANAVKERKT